MISCLGGGIRLQSMEWIVIGNDNIILSCVLLGQPFFTERQGN